MKGRIVPILLALAVLLALSVGLSTAQGPGSTLPTGESNGELQTAVGSAFTYQGQLNKEGSPVDATCTMAFRLYDELSAGDLVGTPITTNVAVADGLFTVALDFPGAFEGEARFLEIAVACPGDAGFITLTPRQELTAAPYALSLRPGAVISGTVAGGIALTVLNGAANGGAVYARGPNAVIGISESPGYAAILGRNTAITDTTYGVYGLSDSTEGYGVYGRSNHIGVYGETSSTGGNGVFGYSMATSGETYGVYGRSNSTEGIGVFGRAAATSGTTWGVYGRSDSTAGTGVYGYNSSTSSGIGVHGVGPNAVLGDSSTPGYAAVMGRNMATTGTGMGVYGQTYSTEGRGVHGYASATTGDARGVYGRSDSTAGYGVFGWATAATGYGSGVYGTASSADGCGVTGSNDGGTGVSGYTETGTGVYGHADGNGVAIKAEGQVGGNLIEAWHGPLFLDRKFYVADNGNVYADGSYLNPAAGYAEMMPGTAGLEAGDVLVVGLDGKLARCTAAYQPTVVGVYAPQAGFIGGAVEGATGQVPLAVVGVVTVKVSTENGPIAAGDLLVAADTAGYAMRASADPPLGTVIGKALEGLDTGTGTILMLVMLR